MGSTPIIPTNIHRGNTMDLRAKIEEEITKLEKELSDSPTYIRIRELEHQLNQEKYLIQNHPTYQTLQTLKTLLAETSDYKILETTHIGAKGKRARPERLEDTSHYREMLDFIEAYMEGDINPRNITELYNLVREARYSIGGKRPAYTLSAYLSRDPRFTATNKGWILTKKVNRDAI